MIQEDLVHFNQHDYIGQEFVEVHHWTGVTFIIHSHSARSRARVVAAITDDEVMANATIAKQHTDTILISTCTIDSGSKDGLYSLKQVIIMLKTDHSFTLLYAVNVLNNPPVPVKCRTRVVRWCNYRIALNFTGVSAVLLPMCLSNSKAIWNSEPKSHNLETS